MPEHTVKSKIINYSTEDSYLLLSELGKYPNLTQRELALKLNVSLGKTNYLIKQLIKKGLLKVRSFSENQGKLGKVKYYLTTKGIQHKVKLTYYFLKCKEAEYYILKKEWDQLNSLAINIKKNILTSEEKV